MITEDYVSFEIAKLLKEKGFDWRTILSYDKDGRMKNALRPFFVDGDLAMPTLQMAMKWLRQKHKITIGILFKGDRIYYEIHKNNEFVFGVDTPESYEKVCDEAIKYCLKILI